MSRFVVVLLTLVSTAACSIALTRGAGDHRAVPGGPPPSCTSAVVLPILDAVIAAALVAVKVSATREACADPKDPNGCSIVGGTSTVIFGLPALTFGISSLVGAVKVRGCRDAKSAYARVQHDPR